MSSSKVSTKPNPVIETGQGKLKGVVLQSRESKDYFAFYGIPYAKRPERFEPSEKWEPWEGTWDGTKPGERCPQSSLITRRVFGSEDCLFANVFTPQLPQSLDGRMQGKEKDTLLPVVVFIFGGGYYVGGGDLYGGKYLTDQGVVLVTFNYRIGAFGFLNSGDGKVRGNMGLKDQVMCLKWVQENIHHFSGDNQSVTIVGESAGGACVHFHMMSPMSKGLFHKAIMQSGNALSPWAFSKNPVEKVRELVKRLELDCDLNDMADIIECLKKIDPYSIATQRLNYSEWKEQPQIPFVPSIESGPLREDTFLSESPLERLQSYKLETEVPLILGVNAQEGAYKAIPLLRNSKKLQSLNENWGNDAYQYILYEKSQSNSDLVTTVREFYFRDNPITLEGSGSALTNMFSDRWFIYSTNLTALYHSHIQTAENPIYLYVFNYEGEHSYLNAFGVFDTHGVTHADELQYIFDQKIFYSQIHRGTEDDFMIGKMSEMWGNFAKTGVPSHSHRDFGWKPILLDESPDIDTTNNPLTNPPKRCLKYYRISKTDEMVEEPFKSRMDFWDKIPLN